MLLALKKLVNNNLSKFFFLKLMSSGNVIQYSNDFRVEERCIE